jgi:hypothetical protein
VERRPPKRGIPAGQKSVVLVGVTGFEPAASSSPTISGVVQLVAAGLGRQVCRVESSPLKPNVPLPPAHAELDATAENRAVMEGVHSANRGTSPASKYMGFQADRNVDLRLPVMTQKGVAAMLKL